MTTRDRAAFAAARAAALLMLDDDQELIDVFYHFGRWNARFVNYNGHLCWKPIAVHWFD